MPGTVSPPVGARPRLLPLRDPNFTWELFEDLCVTIARDVEGYRHVESYGRRGQAQRGADVIARSAGRLTTVYQAKDIKTLTASSLRRAVRASLVEGHLAAERFVLCVTCSARDTKVSDALEELRRAHAPLQIEIYDDAYISDLLRDRPGIVQVFFPAWTTAFCVTPSGTRLDAEALLRGPVKALNLEHVVAEAHGSLASDPRQAAELFSDVAHRLASEYPSQARTFRGRAAEALGRAGDHGSAFDAWFELAQEELWDRSEPRATPSVRAALRDLSPSVDGARQLKADIVAAWEEWHENSAARTELLRMAEKLYALRDPFAVRAAMWALEAHLVDDDRDPITSRAGWFTEFVGDLESSEQVRLRVGIADAVGESSWTPLYATATARDFPLMDAAYVALRAGRFRAWAGDFDGAELALRRAIELGAEAALDLDVENALWSLVTLYAEHGVHDARLHSANELALGIDGARSYVPQHPRTRTFALRAISQHSQQPDAHMWLRHEQWESLIGGCLITELEALGDLGTLYERSAADTTDERARAAIQSAAIEAYVRGGHSKPAREVSKRTSMWSTAFSAVSASSLWQRNAALHALAGAGDFVPDDVAHGLVPLLLAQLADVPGPLAAISAEVVGQVARQLSLDDARRVADAFALLAPRGPNRYRFTDPGMLLFVGRTYGLHRPLRPQLAQLLAECAVGSGVDADLVRAVEACANDPQPVIDSLRAQVDAGHAAALELLAMVDEDDSRVRVKMDARLVEILDRPSARGSGSLSLRSDFALTRTALRGLAPDRRRAYAEKLLAISCNEHEPVIARVGALDALAFASAALTASERALLFPAVLELTRDVRISPIEVRQQQTNHPLSRFRFNLGGPVDVRVAALGACVALGTTEQDDEAVAAAGFALQREPHAAHALSRALVALGRRGRTANMTVLLAGSPQPELRQAAAALWCARPNPPEVGRALARDPVMLVRRELALGLGALQALDTMLSEELRTLLASDPSAAVRVATAEAQVREGSQS